MTGDPEQFGGRQVIGPETDVLNGVFLTREHGAIVVDFAENPRLYEMGYNAVASRLACGKTQPPPPIALARVVNQVVKEMVPFRYADEKAILAEEAAKRDLESIGPQDEVELSRFIGGGACQHQTLFGASLLCLLQKRQGVGGTVSVRTEPIEHDPGNRQHTWIRYINGRRIIIDSAVHRTSLFTIEELETPIEPKRRFYLTPEELRELVEDRDLSPEDVHRLTNHDLIDPAKVPDFQT